MDAMRAVVPIAPIVLLVASCHASPPVFTTGGDDVAAVAGRTYRWSFDEAGPAGAPRRVFLGVLGDWRVTRDPAAASPPNVMREVKPYAARESPRLVVADLAFADADVRVRCRPDSAGAACGVMIAFESSDDYVDVRVEGEALRVERVVGGAPQELASVPCALGAGEWHLLEAHIRGAHVSASVSTSGGAASLDADLGAPLRGKIGLLTRGEADVAFDDLEATELPK
jgi:hypothetical protein